MFVADFSFMAERARIDDLALTLYYADTELGLADRTDRIAALRPLVRGWKARNWVFWLCLGGVCRMRSISRLALAGVSGSDLFYTALWTAIWQSSGSLPSAWRAAICTPAQASARP